MVKVPNVKRVTFGHSYFWQDYSRRLFKTFRYLPKLPRTFGGAFFMRSGLPLPRRLKIYHRILSRRRIAPIMRVLWHPRRDRPKPRCAGRRLGMKHDAADMLAAVEHLIVFVRRLAAWVGFDLLRCLLAHEQRFPFLQYG